MKGVHAIENYGVFGLLSKRFRKGMAILSELQHSSYRPLDMERHTTVYHVDCWKQRSDSIEKACESALLLHLLVDNFRTLITKTGDGRLG